MVMPGDNVEMEVELIVPIAMEEEVFALRSVKVAVPLVLASLHQSIIKF